MRKLTGHHINPCNNALDIQVMDEPGSGGANHRYEITGFDTNTNPSATRPDGYKVGFGRIIILFQNGPIGEAGTNGITHEALLEILIDRLEGFQRGPYASPSNQTALEHIRAAQESLHSRTKERTARGVEGTHKV